MWLLSLFTDIFFTKIENNFIAGIWIWYLTLTEVVFGFEQNTNGLVSNYVCISCKNLLKIQSLIISIIKIIMELSP